MAAHPGAAEGGQSGGLLKALAAAAALGTFGPVAAPAYGEDVEPATFSVLRARVCAAILGALVISRRQPSVSLARLAPRERALLALAVGLVMVVFCCYPVLVALISAALGRERLTPVRILALAFACAGRR